MASIEPHGLTWIRAGWESYPEWTVELDPDAIRRTVEDVLQIQEPCSISYLDEGTFNQIWVLRNRHCEFVARVTLPVDPTIKTLSEVATLHWVRENTALPVPRVLAYHAAPNNSIGFEWIAMTLVPGMKLEDAWSDISFGAKVRLVDQIADFVADCFENQLEGIGNVVPELGRETRSITPPPEPRATGHNEWARYQYQARTIAFREARNRRLQLGEMVSTDFIWDDRFLDDVPRGPFTSTREWIAVQLTLVERSVRRYMDKLVPPDDDEAWKDFFDAHEDLVDDFDCTLSVIDRLWDYFYEYLPDDVNGLFPEPTMIMHNMSSRNILVHPDGTLSGVVDWECTPALPLWMACQYPGFLRGATVRVPPEPTAFRNGTRDKDYLGQMHDFEKTLLRRHFMNAMAAREPRFVRIYEASQRQRDFELAVDFCDHGAVKHIIERWLDDVDDGIRGPSLEERIDNGCPYAGRPN